MCGIFFFSHISDRLKKILFKKKRRCERSKNFYISQLSSQINTIHTVNSSTMKTKMMTCVELRPMGVLGMFNNAILLGMLLF